MKCSSPNSAFLLLLVTACGSTKFNQVGQRFPARERMCEIRVLTAAPRTGFVEIGTIDVKGGSYGANEFRDTEAFRREVRLLVCEAGGDAVVAQMNAKGLYVKGTVLKAAASAAQTGPVAAPAVVPASTVSAGCSFDAQCKGDRICVNGTCVSAEATPITKP